MSAITDLSDLLNLLTGGGAVAPEPIWAFKDGRVGAAAVATVAGQYSSLWQYNGQRPTHGAVPGASARIPTRATDGAIGQVNPTGGRQKWLVSNPLFAPTQAGVLICADRLADISGLSGVAAGAQAISGLAVTRYAGAASAGNEIWVEIYTAVGATARTITASYTNQAGTAGRTTQAAVFGGTGANEAQRMIRLPLQQGDTGVRSVESVTISATTGTAGDFGVTILRAIAGAAATNPAIGTSRELTRGYPGLVEVATDAALFFMWQAAGAVAPAINSQLMFVEK